MNINRLLTDDDRELYEPVIQKLFELAPDIMSRKITIANVQQAFVLDTVLLNCPVGMTVLDVGSFEDPVPVSLQALGYGVVAIDPAINYDLHTFRGVSADKFNVVTAVSVLEHVKDDVEFIADICQLLLPGGLAILTCDFRDSYIVGEPLPATDVRLYTNNDLYGRLNDVIRSNDCFLVDEPDWSGEPDFLYQGHVYNLATFVFRKND